MSIWRFAFICIVAVATSGCAPGEATDLIPLRLRAKDYDPKLYGAASTPATQKSRKEVSFKLRRSKFMLRLHLPFAEPRRLAFGSSPRSEPGFSAAVLPAWMNDDGDGSQSGCQGSPSISNTINSAFGSACVDVDPTADSALFN